MDTTDFAAYGITPEQNATELVTSYGLETATTRMVKAIAHETEHLTRTKNNILLTRLIERDINYYQATLNAIKAGA
jgi:hypothetical protein